MDKNNLKTINSISKEKEKKKREKKQSYIFKKNLNYISRPTKMY